MKRKELMQWALAVVLVGAAVVVLKWGPSAQTAEAADGTATMSEMTECQ